MDIPKNFETKIDFKMPKPTISAKEAPKEYKAASRGIVNGCLKASKEIEYSLPAELTKSMTQAIWGPFNPKESYFRRNGELVGSGTRDLIDMGTLHDSLKISTNFLKTKSQTKITYSAPYAAITHDGGAIVPYGDPKNGTRILPPRPWIEYTVGSADGMKGRYDVRAVYERNVTDAFNSGQ
jgi:hypothetical protein